MLGTGLLPQARNLIIKNGRLGHFFTVVSFVTLATHSLISFIQFSFHFSFFVINQESTCGYKYIGWLNILKRYVTFNSHFLVKYVFTRKSCITKQNLKNESRTELSQFPLNVYIGWVKPSFLQYAEMAYLQCPLKYVK